MRADQGDIKPAFGFIPLFTGTLLITLIAMCVAGPLGLFSAIYLSEYASAACALPPSLCSKFWPAFRPWCSAFSRL